MTVGEPSPAPSRDGAAAPQRSAVAAARTPDGPGGLPVGAAVAAYVVALLLALAACAVVLFPDLLRRRP